jgi:hypothetical protein
MRAWKPRFLPVAAALGLVGGLAVIPAASAPATGATQPPWPSNEGPPGPPALMPSGRVASPPQATSPQISTGCPAAPYGANYYAPGTGKTVALTFDDGPARARRASSQSCAPAE